jgi:hypothetical protein
MNNLPKHPSSLLEIFKKILASFNSDLAEIELQNYVTES